MVGTRRIERASWFLLAIEAKARSVADSGNHSGFKGSSAHLAGEPVVLIVKREGLRREPDQASIDSKWFGERRVVG